LITKKEKTINYVVEKLRHVEGIRAVALTGSTSYGTSISQSDIDLMLLYDKKNPININRLKSIVFELSDFKNPLVTPFGAWGELSDGGVYVVIKTVVFNMFYKCIDYLFEVFGQLEKGRFRSDYVGPLPYGLHTYSLCGSVKKLKPLYDQKGIITALKKQVPSYPPRLKKNILRFFLGQARRSLDEARMAAARNQTYLLVGDLARTVNSFIQVLYALNEIYFTVDKSFYHDFRFMKKSPVRFLERAESLLFLKKSTAATMEKKVSEGEKLFKELISLCPSSSFPVFYNYRR